MRVPDSNGNEEVEANRKRRHELPLRSTHVCKRRRCKRVEYVLTAPSYTLKLGSLNLRLENRIRLRYLLRRLVSRHNWVEASGVLSVLLKGTCHEQSPHCKEIALRNNRFKYSVAMELLKHMGKDPRAYSTKIDDLYHAWILNIRSYKNTPFKDRYILLDHVLSSIARTEDLTAHDHSTAHIALKSLKLISESGRDPMSYLVIGLASYEVWYSGLLVTIRQENLDELSMPLQSETVGDSSFRVLDGLRDEDAASVNETCSNVQNEIETSVANYKDVQSDVHRNRDKESSVANAAPAVEHSEHFQPQDLDMKSIESSEVTDDSTTDHYGQFCFSSAINVHGLQTLLPLRLPFPENLVNLNFNKREYYKDAVKYLTLALQAPPPVSTAALLPLVQWCNIFGLKLPKMLHHCQTNLGISTRMFDICSQLLVFGDEVKEAFLTVQQFCTESGSVVPYRLMACLQECVNVNQYDILSSSFEDVMKKDPTCKSSLRRLINLRQRGEYAHERLVEMLALHLEATYGDHVTWKEFASCLLILSHCEEDTMSTCVKGKQDMNEQRCSIRFRRVPSMFVEGMSKKTWKLRCKWWLNRHFGKHSVKFDVEKGNWKLLAYKAACASHLYGKDFEYVIKVYECVKEHDTKLLSFLQTHLDNSLGYFSLLVKR